MLHYNSQFLSETIKDLKKKEKKTFLHYEGRVVVLTLHESLCILYVAYTL